MGEGRKNKLAPFSLPLSIPYTRRLSESTRRPDPRCVKHTIEAPVGCEGNQPSEKENADAQAGRAQPVRLFVFGCRNGKGGLSTGFYQLNIMYVAKWNGPTSPKILDVSSNPGLLVFVQITDCFTVGVPGTFEVGFRFKRSRCTVFGVRCTVEEEYYCIRT